jgi:hypothetical protein
VLLLILDALACLRLTRLVVSDHITERFRHWAVGSIPSSDRLLDGTRIPVAARPRMALFLSCPHCVSFWTAIGVVLMQSLIAGPWFDASVVLAFSAVAGPLAEHA